GTGISAPGGGMPQNGALLQGSTTTTTLPECRPVCMRKTPQLKGWFNTCDHSLLRKAMCSHCNAIYMPGRTVPGWYDGCNNNLIMEVEVERTTTIATTTTQSTQTTVQSAVSTSISPSTGISSLSSLTTSNSALTSSSSSWRSSLASSAVSSIISLAG
ncbi:MAG: hypothetical protein V1703_00625, partial [Candidatus Altiarchaeota archaeon]